MNRKSFITRLASLALGLEILAIQSINKLKVDVNENPETLKVNLDYINARYEVAFMFSTDGYPGDPVVADRLNKDLKYWTNAYPLRGNSLTKNGDLVPIAPFIQS